MQIGETVYTVTGCQIPGEYTVVALLGEQRGTDDRRNLAVARRADGPHEVLVEDNAGCWPLGNEDDADDNRDTFAAVGGGKEGQDEEALAAAAKAGAFRVLDHLADIRAIDAGLADWIAERAHEACRNLARTEYEVWLVPQGVAFAQGYTKGATMLGSSEDLEAVREIVARAASETFCEEGGEYDRIFDECAAARPEEEPEGFSEPAIAHDKFVEAARRDLCFDAGDLKTVRVREVRWNPAGTECRFVRVV